MNTHLESKWKLVHTEVNCVFCEHSMKHTSPNLMRYITVH